MYKDIGYNAGGQHRDCVCRFWRLHLSSKYAFDIKRECFISGHLWKGICQSWLVVKKLALAWCWKGKRECKMPWKKKFQVGRAQLDLQDLHVSHNSYQWFPKPVSFLFPCGSSKCHVEKKEISISSKCRVEKRIQNWMPFQSYIEANPLPEMSRD